MGGAPWTRPGGGDRVLATNGPSAGGVGRAGGTVVCGTVFGTGALGLLLLSPPFRVVARSALKRRFQGRVTYYGSAPGAGRLDGPDDIIDI